MNFYKIVKINLREGISRNIKSDLDRSEALRIELAQFASVRMAFRRKYSFIDALSLALIHEKVIDLVIGLIPLHFLLDSTKFEARRRRGARQNVVGSARKSRVSLLWPGDLYSRKSDGRVRGLVNTPRYAKGQS